MKSHGVVVFGCALVAAASTASAFFENPFTTIEAEPNNSLEAAQNVEPGRVFDAWGSDFTNFFEATVTGTIEPGDVDYYRIDTSEGMPQVTLMDIYVTGTPGMAVQLLALDASTGSVIDFVSAPGGAFQYCRLDDGAVPGEARSYVFAVSAGNDLDPADTNPNLPFGLGPLLGASAAFDGSDYQSGQPHGAAFSYTLTFVPGFIPTPATGSVPLFAALILAPKRRRGSSI